MDITCGGFTFISNFDSGNLARVEQVFVDEDTGDAAASTGNNSFSNNMNDDIPEFEFNIWTYPDCAGTEFENGNRSWFHFGIKGAPPFALIKLNIVNLNRQTKMYSQGMAPVYRTVPSRNTNWERIRDKPTYKVEDNVFTLSFKYRSLENNKATTYFAFTYPYSYTELQSYLHSIDSKMAKFCESGNESKLDDIYYHRDVVCYSLEERRIDLITISSHHGITSTREPQLAGLFPDNSIPRAFQFNDKKVIFISARVHPGETPSSFVFTGLLNTLLSKDDVMGTILRRLYVFKMIPMLNPDGVFRGHYRTDTRGINLNRVYNCPSLKLHPSVFAARSLIRYYHHKCELPDILEAQDFINEDRTNERVSVLSEERGSTNSNSTAEDVVTLVNNNINKNNSSSSYALISNANNIKEGNSSGQRSTANTSAATEKKSSVLDECKENNPTLQDENRLANYQPPPQSAPSFKSMDSGLFLYVDLHGHASKKGIFMYGNHFNNLADKVECLLLPKLMSLNNQHFHFSACNFSEKNMYIRDKNGGMTREGSGRVAVFKATGLVRSYTLECNYNSGRIVNVMPAAIKETLEKRNTPILVPPKYTPQIFEEVGRALCCSILDLTSSNLNSRLSNSEFRNLAGVREWLRIHPLNESNVAARSSIKVKSGNQENLHFWS